MVNAARKYNRVTQVGTQQRSMPINNWASDLVKNGALGKILTVIAPNFVGPDPLDQPARRADVKGGSEQLVGRLDQPGRAAALPHVDSRGWARWWDYDGGGLCFGVTGWGTHSYDQINRGLGTDDTGPVEVVLEEPVNVRDTGKFARELRPSAASIGDAEDTGTDYHGMAKLSGPRAKVTMKFASGTELQLAPRRRPRPRLGGDLRRRKGQDRDQPQQDRQQPEGNRPSRRTTPAPTSGPRRPTTSRTGSSASRAASRCNADIEIGQRATTLCYLVNIVRDVGRVGEALQWDPAAERFTNCDEANKLLSRPRRKGYELPKIA